MPSTSHKPTVFRNPQDALEFAEKLEGLRRQNHDSSGPRAQMSPEEMELHQAASLGNLERVQELVSQGVNPMALSSQQWSPLMVAARSGHAEIVQWLLPRSDAQAVNVSGRSALHWAAVRHEHACVELLSPHSNPLAQDAWGDTPLILGAGSAECVSLLLPLSDPNACNDLGVTALMKAAEHENLRGLRELATCCNLDQQDSLGNTALMWAARDGNLESVKVLAPLCNPDIQNARGETALSMAASFTAAEPEAEAEAAACLDKLLERANPDLQNERGMTPLMLAMERGNWSSSEKLSRVSDPMVTNIDGLTALDMAVSSPAPARVKIVECLYESTRSLLKPEFEQTATIKHSLGRKPSRGMELS